MTSKFLWNHNNLQNYDNQRRQKSHVKRLILSVHQALLVQCFLNARLIKFLPLMPVSILTSYEKDFKRVSDLRIIVSLETSCDLSSKCITRAAMANAEQMGAISPEVCGSRKDRWATECALSKNWLQCQWNVVKLTKSKIKLETDQHLRNQVNLIKKFRTRNRLVLWIMNVQWN